MSARDSSPRTQQHAAAFSRWVGLGGPDLRISDAERAEAADRLARHFAEGRLDQAEFDQRSGQAMRAKTHADLRGLFTDLPPADSDEARSQPGRRSHHPLLLLAVIVLLVVVAADAGRALMALFLPWWLVAGLLVLLLLYFGPPRRRRR